MSIDTMTGLTFIFLVLTVIFTFFKKRRLSLTFSVLSLVMFIWANWNYIYLTFLSLRDMLFQK